MVEVQLLNLFICKVKPVADLHQAGAGHCAQKARINNQASVPIGSVQADFYGNAKAGLMISQLDRASVPVGKNKIYLPGWEE